MGIEIESQPNPSSTGEGVAMNTAAAMNQAP
jgi:hypothetical protein